VLHGPAGGTATAGAPPGLNRRLWSADQLVARQSNGSVALDEDRLVSVRIVIVRQRRADTCGHPCAAPGAVANLASVTDAARSDDRPALVAYDGSDESVAALRNAVALFRVRTLIVVSVWEPGLGTAMASVSGLALGSPSAEMLSRARLVERDYAASAANAGAALARELGASAEPIAITDQEDVAAAITAEADQNDVCAIAVGSRGLGRVRAPLLGSTSQAVLRHTRRPVLVVRAAT
jgi:nucleotide-binding universal stress UspA family protein